MDATGEGMSQARCCWRLIPSPAAPIAWRTQALVDTISAVSGLELLGTDTADMAMATGSIVERVDVICDVGEG